jgi:hypothetical protein
MSNSVQSAPIAAQVPGKPIELGLENTLEKFADLYVLHFRHGMQPTCNKGFYCVGGLRKAIVRAQKHCEIMGYVCIFVRPLIADIDTEEQHRLGND